MPRTPTSSVSSASNPPAYWVDPLAEKQPQALNCAVVMPGRGWQWRDSWRVAPEWHPEPAMSSNKSAVTLVQRENVRAMRLASRDAVGIRAMGVAGIWTATPDPDRVNEN